MAITGVIPFREKPCVLSFSWDNVVDIGEDIYICRSISPPTYQAILFFFPNLQDLFLVIKSGLKQLASSVLSLPFSLLLCLSHSYHLDYLRVVHVLLQLMN